ncbi:MAG: DHA2 family efflux MFS transporter permease subunit [Candidatus Eisenbacteria bacterium]|uniref:DHA2 family efflux MFS transporter permease subunit n=1 Tax=Eiseniibacteriota bacterium TaxID=2212470 RepID=A0A538TWG7_UNCEI|nr:MAG: DHA2 family efflux MFS transporter permease subunit [Candidatus Eisenbacteria bacterium]
MLLGTLMAVLDASIVNVALPTMRGSLGATVEEITWVITGYILSSVIVMPAIALASARLGRRNFYLANIVLFTLASALCGMARSLPMMVLFRVLQGLGGGVLMTVSQAILRETFPPQEQGLAMGIYGLGVVLAPAFGPTLGGWITDQFSWPWVFLINVPIGAVNVLLAARYIHDPPYLERDTGSLDVPGLAWMVIGLGCLQLMLEKGESKDWFQSRMIVTLAIVSVIALVLFIHRELTVRRPAVDLRLLEIPALASATAIVGVLGAGLFGSLFLLPVFLQGLLGYSATQSGLALMPRSLAMAVCIGPRWLVGVGLVVSAWSFYELSHLTTSIGVVDLLVPQVTQGIGFSLIFVALSTAALADVPRPQITAAAGLYNVVRQVFGSVGVAMAATLVSSGAEKFRSTLSASVTPYSPAARQWLSTVTAAMQARGADPATAARRALQLLDLDVGRQATVLAYNRVFVQVAVLFAVALPLVFALHKGRREGGSQAMAAD